jgi:DeoR family transcriptional regulator, ulaG and ulaABCDEF operon transcriptional repressor
MHSAERENLILDHLRGHPFLSFKELEKKIDASPATIRRDLHRLAEEGRLKRVRGGVMANGGTKANSPALSDGETFRLGGTTFAENLQIAQREKSAIARKAAELCAAGEGIMIDGGTTTFQMCSHLDGLNLQVLTNSLHIALSLIGQQGTRVLVPSGAVFPEQNIILSIFGEDGMPQFHAGKLFMGASSIGPKGLMQLDVVLVAAERRLIEKADQIVVLADSRKFLAASGHVVCGLDAIDIVITDKGISAQARTMLEEHGVQLIIA